MFQITRRARNNWLNPFLDLEGLQSEMNRLFDQTLSKPSEKAGGSLFEGALWSPAVDVYETSQNFVVKADLPGIDKDKIDVTVQGDTLILRGEKTEEKEQKEKEYIRTERVYGSFSRAILLPSGVDANNIKAGYKNGVLELTIPKKEEVKPKQIKIDVDK